MARKKTPSELREEAKKLMEQAAEEERMRQQKIGELVSAAIEKDFAGFDFAEFKAQAIQIWNGGNNGGGTTTKKAKTNVSGPDTEGETALRPVAASRA